MKYPFLVANFRSPLDLDAVCALLSARLFANAAFHPSNAREEVPCRALQGGVLGMRVLIYGYGGADGYQLWIDPIFPPDFPIAILDRDSVRLDEYLFHVLASIDQIEPLAHDFTDEPPLTPEQRAQLEELFRQSDQTVRRIRTGLEKP
jgi:hypothetical protein